jgi:hypothetical protein
MLEKMILPPSVYPLSIFINSMKKVPQSIIHQRIETPSNFKEVGKIRILNLLVFALDD